jgi:hypothetical protein
VSDEEGEKVAGIFDFSVSHLWDHVAVGEAVKEGLCAVICPPSRSGYRHGFSTHSHRRAIIGSVLAAGRAGGRQAWIGDEHSAAKRPGKEGRPDNGERCNSHIA